ncbi:hypothetical protein ACFLT0_01545 [Chloroflexota bacterium]
MTYHELLRQPNIAGKELKGKVRNGGSMDVIMEKETIARTTRRLTFCQECSQNCQVEVETAPQETVNSGCAHPSKLILGFLG